MKSERENSCYKRLINSNHLGQIKMTSIFVLQDPKENTLAIDVPVKSNPMNSNNILS